jgi:hypothetical protein
MNIWKLRTLQIELISCINMLVDSLTRQPFNLFLPQAKQNSRLPSTTLEGCPGTPDRLFRAKCPFNPLFQLAETKVISISLEECQQ